MIAGPSSAESLEKFAMIGAALRNAGLAAPEVFEIDPTAGLMLLADLGSPDIAKTVQLDPKLANSCYDIATDILLKMPEVAALPLETLTAQNAARWLAPLRVWYDKAPLDISHIQDEMIAAFATFDMKPDTLALRDYHAENLLTEKMAKATNLSFSDFAAQTALLSVQRNLRILGIFASLAKRDGKTQYTAFAPRVWGYLMRDLAHPALPKLQRAVTAVVPEPTQEHLAQWTP